MKSLLLMVATLASLHHSAKLSPPVSRPEAVRSLATEKRASKQFADCYDYAGQRGDRVHVTDYITSLRNYNFDNRIESCCFTGIWMLYDKDNYNKGSSSSADWWVYGDNYCKDVPSGFANKASSIRFTGAPDDWKYDTLNLYFEEYFIGDEEFTYNDAAVMNYDNRAQSVVVTGCSAWTLYEYSNYQGRKVCVYPQDTSQCTPGFYSTRQSLGSLAGTVSSVRRGCYAEESRRPDNYKAEGRRVEEKENGASGFFP